MKNLTQLKPGDKGVIAEIRGNGAFAERLLAMGFTPGTMIRLMKTAPLGDPLEILCRGFRLMLRKQEAAQIRLEG